MKVKKNKNLNYEEMNWIELSFFWLLIIQVLFINWLIGSKLIIYIQVAIFAYLFCLMYKGIMKIKIEQFLLIYGFFIIILLNLIINGTGSYTLTNIFKYSIGNLVIVMFFFHVFTEKREFFKQNLLKKIFVVFNLYFFVNIPIIIMQMKGNYFLMRNHENNPMYEDHITGLIGASGTHILTLFWISLIAINLYFVKKKFVIILTSIEIFIMMFFSAKNDNTIFIFLLPIIIIQIFLPELKKKKIKKILIGIVIISISTLTINYLIINDEDFRDFYNDRVLIKFEQITKKQENRSSTKMKDEERIALFKYALENGNGYRFGKGIGSVTYGDKKMPAHFGMSEISIKVYEGGLVYLFALIILYAYYYRKIILNNFRVKLKLSKRIVTFLVIGNCILLASYTQIFRVSEIAILMCFLSQFVNLKLVE